MTQVTVRKYPRTGHNGDRATHTTGYFDYHVEVNDFEVATFSPLDGFQQHIATGTYDTSCRDATKFALGLSDALCCSDPHFATMKMEVVHEEKWVEDES